MICMKLKEMPELKRTSPLPDYDKPPVIEVILGVQFERLAGLKNAHLGAFWKSLGPDWPTVADAPPLPHQFERFIESAKWGNLGAQLMLTSDVAARLQIKSRQGDQMVQVQNGRFHFNWLGQTGDEYPRYEKVREGFAWAFRHFMEFLHTENLGGLKPNQWEVTYLNHIPQGTVWNTPRDWSFFRPLAGLPTMAEIIQGESFGGEWHFLIGEKLGRLHVNWQHGVKSEPNGTEMVVLTFTARGALENVEPNVLPAVVTGLDLGRETIVRSFEKLMSNEANKYWGLKNVGN